LSDFTISQIVLFRSCWHPSGVQTNFASVSGGIAAPSRPDAASRRLRHRRVLVTIVEAGWSRLEACQRVAGGRSVAEASGRIQNIKHPGGVPERSSIMD